nr:ectonucleotide pyrophosphatase/phosphodiesterase family member 5 isoform X2 [Pogona vitticeps]
MSLNGSWRYLAICVLILPGTLCFLQDQPKVLLVSFDGFRWDYIYKFPTPNFQYIIKNGIHVEQVTNAFITKTFPNHYTMVTGLYAESHGVVANEMYDPVLNDSFSMNHMTIYNSKFWEDAYPIWITNQMQGHRSGAAMWPGTDVKIHGVFPTHYMPYNESVTFQERVAKLIEWFRSKEPINLGLLYWEQPDELGHILGPDNPLMEKVIRDVDDNLGYLVSELKRENLWDTLNVIITSDHGMAQNSRDRIIELDLYVDRELYRMIDHSPTVALLPEEGGDHGYDNVLPEMHPIFLALGPAFRRNFSKQAMNSTDLYPLLCYMLGIDPLPNNGSLESMKDALVNPVHEASQPRFLLDYQQASYAYFIGVILGSTLVLVFLLAFVRHLTYSQTPAVWGRQTEVTQPLLQP